METIENEKKKRASYPPEFLFSSIFSFKHDASRLPSLKNRPTSKLASRYFFPGSEETRLPAKGREKKNKHSEENFHWKNFPNKLSKA